MERIQDRVAIVTGAAQGLGEAFALRLAAEGAKVLAVDCQESVLAQFSSDRITPLVADVSQRAECEAIVARAAGIGSIGVLVNNAGRWKQTPVDSPWEQALADWDEIMDTNLLGVLMLGRLVVPHMIEARQGDIVNVSTYYVLPARSEGTNPPDTDLYAASKWALNGFTDAWALHLAKHDIRVNGLCMGATDTGMLRGLFDDGELPEQFAKVVMKPTDIAGQLVDLIEDGRTGENVGAWVGHPIELGARKPADRRITG
jgi:NAD(P)-dependent dehydrogenase (short-subunit alcohol dehydrogenase family)